MFRRRRPLLRAAVVGGGAYAAGRHMANKSNQQAADEAYEFGIRRYFVGLNRYTRAGGMK